MEVAQKGCLKNFDQLELEWLEGIQMKKLRSVLLIPLGVLAVFCPFFWGIGSYPKPEIRAGCL